MGAAGAGTSLAGFRSEGNGITAVVGKGPTAVGFVSGAGWEGGADWIGSGRGATGARGRKGKTAGSAGAVNRTGGFDDGGAGRASKGVAR